MCELTFFILNSLLNSVIHNHFSCILVCCMYIFVIFYECNNLDAHNCIILLYSHLSWQVRRVCMQKYHVTIRYPNSDTECVGERPLIPPEWDTFPFESAVVSPMPSGRTCLLLLLLPFPCSYCIYSHSCKLLSCFWCWCSCWFDVQTRTHVHIW